MWRCHCGETNLNTDTHCRECSGPRGTHEDPEREPRLRPRKKTVYIGFFGMGMGPEREGSGAPRRPMSDRELDSYYSRSRRSLRLQWIAFGVGVLIVALVLIWQVIRPDR